MATSKIKSTSIQRTNIRHQKEATELLSSIHVAMLALAKVLEDKELRRNHAAVDTVFRHLTGCLLTLRDFMTTPEKMASLPHEDRVGLLLFVREFRASAASLVRRSEAAQKKKLAPKRPQKRAPRK